MRPQCSRGRGSEGSKLAEIIANCPKCSPVDRPMVEVYQRWLPAEVRVLAIGESPPPGVKPNLLYNLEVEDRMRRSMAYILGVSYGREVLEALTSRGVFVTGSVKCRPRGRGEVESMRRRCTFTLKAELELLKPRRVVAMGRAAARSISEVLGLEPPSRLNEPLKLEAGGVEVAFTPHPNYIFRFRRDLASTLRELLLG